MTRGTNIRLREWQEKDLAFLLHLRNDVALQAKLLATARGSDTAGVRNWATQRSEGSDQVFYIIAHGQTDDPIGYLQAERLTETSGDWKFGICLDGPFQGKGWGGAALRLLERLLICEHAAVRLRLVVDRQNAHAIACYQKLGYSPTGFVPDPVFVADEIRDVFEMARSLDDRSDGK